MPEKSIVFGMLEKVTIPAWGQTVIAKIDTGAYSGALHVEDLHIEQTEAGEQLVFRPFYEKANLVRSDEFIIRKIRSTSGEMERRYIIPISLRIDDREYDTMISVTDRSGLTFPIILGRRLLNEYNILVDVRRNLHLRPAEGANW